MQLEHNQDPAQPEQVPRQSPDDGGLPAPLVHVGVFGCVEALGVEPEEHEQHRQPDDDQDAQRLGDMVDAGQLRHGELGHG